MPDQTNGNSQQIQCIDHLFTVLAGAEPPREATRPAAEPTETGPQPAAWLARADWQAEYQWIQEEKKRLEAYTLSQLALVRQQREELLQRKSSTEQVMIQREQELNRQARLLASAGELLKRREQAVAERETALTSQAQTLAQVQEHVRALQEARDQLERDIEQRSLQLEQQRLQATQLEEATRAARTELFNSEKTLKERQRACEQEQAVLAAARSQLEQRRAALEKDEEAMKRRLAELEEIESRLGSDSNAGPPWRRTKRR
jgi:chromosome segregation ATPase